MLEYVDDRFVLIRCIQDFSIDVTFDDGDSKTDGEYFCFVEGQYYDACLIAGEMFSSTVVNDTLIVHHLQGEYVDPALFSEYFEFERFLVHDELDIDAERDDALLTTLEVAEDYLFDD